MKRPAASGSAAPAGRPRGSAAAARQAGSGPPQQVQHAVWLMYGGAALTAVTVLISLLTTHGLRAAIVASTKKHLTPAQISGTEHLIVGQAIFGGLVGVALWLLMAQANRNGHRWARIAASVLFGLNTVSLLESVTHAHTLIGLAFTTAIWLVGLAAIVLLWRPEASDYFG